MSKIFLLLVLIVFVLITSVASAQAPSKSQSFQLGNLLAGIQERAGNLVYISEQDWDVNVFVIGKNVSMLDTKTFRAAYPQVSSKEIEEFPLDVFFSRLEKQDKSWAQLRNYLDLNLTQIRVFKMGEIRRDIYVVGLFQGHIVGIRTFSIET